jgi:tetratricopeptide (TPR) repeat protein
MPLPQDPPTDNNLSNHIVNHLEDHLEEIELVDSLNKHSEVLRLRNQNFTKSQEFSEKARDIAAKINYEKGLAWALVNLGSCLVYTDFSNEPYKILKESLAIFRRLNDPVGEAHTLLVVARANLKDENYVSAYYKIEQGLNLSILSNYQKGEILAYYIFALLSEKLEDYESTIRYCRLALSVAGEFDMKSRVLAKIGTTLILTGKTSAARNYLEQALEESEIIGDEFSKALIFIRLGKVNVSEGQTEKAKDNLKKGLELANRIGLFDSANLIIDDILDSYIEFQDYESALEILGEFQKSVEIKNAPHRLAIVLMKVASIKLKMNEPEDAVKLLERILEIAGGGKNKKLLFECEKALADVFELKKDYAQAFGHYKLYHRYKEEFEKTGTANKIKILADRLNIENERNIKQVTREKNSEVAQMVYEVYENIDQLQKARELIAELQIENRKLQTEFVCADCRTRGGIHITDD